MIERRCATSETPEKVAASQKPGAGDPLTGTMRLDLKLSPLVVSVFLAGCASWAPLPHQPEPLTEEPSEAFMRLVMTARARGGPPDST